MSKRGKGTEETKDRLGRGVTQKERIIERRCPCSGLRTKRGSFFPRQRGLRVAQMQHELRKEMLLMSLISIPFCSIDWPQKAISKWPWQLGEYKEGLWKRPKTMEREIQSGEKER